MKKEFKNINDLPKDGKIKDFKKRAFLIRY